MTIHELLLRRFATKKFDTNKKVIDEDLAYILEAARLSCSSSNVQSWHITVVTNPELRAKLREAGYGQPQITDASHLLVVSYVKDPQVRIKTTTEIIKNQSGPESAENYSKMINGLLAPRSEDQKLGWLKSQTYLALQAMILAAAEKGIDSCPMEGFNPAVFAELIGYTDKMPCTLLPIGYAAEPGHPKVRVPLEEMVEYKN